MDQGFVKFKVTWYSRGFSVGVCILLGKLLIHFKLCCMPIEGAMWAFRIFEFEALSSMSPPSHWLPFTATCCCCGSIIFHLYFIQFFVSCYLE